MKSSKSPIVIVVLIVLLLAAGITAFVFNNTASNLRAELDLLTEAATPNVDISQVIPPDGAVTCGLCTGCDEVHFVWPQQNFVNEHVCDGDCDHLGDYLNQDD